MTQILQGILTQLIRVTKDVFHCSTPNDGMSKIHLFSYGLRDTAGLNGLNHTPDTAVLVG